jgi:hypothetical protein
VAIPRSMGWLVVTGAIVLVLVGLSMFALDKPDVVWSTGKPHCPQCRTVVPEYSHRCPACREEFDWFPAPDDASPICTHCLTASQDDFVRDRRKALGEEKAAQRVADATKLSAAAAALYLKAVGRGQCGWCGGTGLDLDRPPDEHAACPVCFGERRCIACDGDRRVRVGVEASSIAITRYEEDVQTLKAEYTPAATARTALRQAAETFLRRHAGTIEAERLLFWPRLGEAKAEVHVALAERSRAVDVARGRLGAVMDALAAD